MKSLTTTEMREVEGGAFWWVSAVAIAAAYARYYYEHRTMGRHVTNYGWLGLKCPICGRP